MVSGVAKSKDIDLVLNFSPDCPEGVVGDGGRLRQVLTNIVGNAVKFTDEGHVLINVKGYTDENTAYITFDIEDTGIGISQNNMAMIFDQFEQVDTSSTRQFEGTGLGLAIAQKIVGIMGGEITVKSELEAGSVFSFVIELEADTEFESASEANNISLHKKSVLVVDDNTVNLRMIQERLESWEMEVMVARSGVDAMAKVYSSLADNQPIDLIISDYQMPGMNGEELLLKIKDEKAFKDIPTIMVSSVTERTSIENRDSVNVDAWLVKPLQASMLFDAIASVLYNIQVSKLKNTHEEMQKLTPRVAVHKARSKTSILMAEDNSVNQMVLRTMLEYSEFSVDMVDNGQEAVDRFNSTNPAMILLDMSMPVMGGVEAAKNIRSLESDTGKRIPIIAVTANVMDTDRKKCHEAGMDDFITKPINREELLETLRKWSANSVKNNALAS